MVFAIENNLGKQYLISGERRNAFILTEKYSETEIYSIYKTAEKKMNIKAELGEIVINWRREEILKILNEILKGFEFYDGF